MDRTKTTGILFLSSFLLLVIVSCGPATRSASESLDPDLGKPAPDQEESAGKQTQSSVPLAGVSGPLPAVAASENVAAANAQDVLISAGGIEIGFTNDGHAYRGNPQAPVVLEEFSDFQCPFCARWTDQTLPSLQENQITAGEVLLVYYDFPLESIHPQAFAAANAARCAGEQGAAAYWDMHDLLYQTVQQWSISSPNTVFSSLAVRLGLDTEQYDVCLEANKYAPQIQEDIDLALSRGVRSTPSFFVNGQSLVGAQPVQIFDQAIATVMSGENISVAESPSAALSPLEPPRVAPTPAAISYDNIAASLGEADAPVTIIEFTDYQCPFCQRHVQETLSQIKSELVESGRVRYVLMDLPLDGLHPEARAAAQAARCAGEQDMYWEMHDILFNSQQQWSGTGAAANEVFVSLSADIGLDVDSYQTCLDEDRYGGAVQNSFDEATALGANSTPFFLIDGYPIPGAQPFDLFSYAVDLAETGELASAYESGEPQVAEAYSVGDPDAPVMIVEFTDYQCPYCGRYYSQTYGRLKEQFIDRGTVFYVFKDFPLNNIHPQAAKAAEAARCAGDQDAYVDMHDKLFESQGEWSGSTQVTAMFAEYAAELGLDSTVFAMCLDSGQHQSAVQQDLDEGLQLGVNGTPAFFINGHSMAGAQPYPIFEQAINQFLGGQ